MVEVAVPEEVVIIRKITREDVAYAEAACLIFRQELRATFRRLDCADVYVALGTSMLPGVVLGMSALERNDEDGEMYLAALAIPKRYQRNGFGSLFVEHAAGIGSELGYSTLSVLPHGDSQGFYEALGFECDEERHIQHPNMLYLALS